MNSARHANRSSNHGQSSRGRGRGGGFDNRQRNSSQVSQSQSQVPTTTHVIPGATVSIVLKADQGTGREVQGVVAELLTKGEHYRGIKVRLRDGRVGRVQRLVREVDASMVGPDRIGVVGRDPQDVGGGSGMMTGERNGGFGGDIMSERPGPNPSGVGLSLADYVVKKKPRNVKLKQDKNGADAEDEIGTAEDDGVEAFRKIESVVSTCPVCREFEGDELAVAHHVNSHFE